MSNAHTMHEATNTHKTIKDSYRRGYRDGIIAGLKKAIVLSNNIQPHTAILECYVAQEIAETEVREI